MVVMVKRPTGELQVGGGTRCRRIQGGMWGRSPFEMTFCASSLAVTGIVPVLWQPTLR